jgi:hypothetical protein
MKKWSLLLGLLPGVLAVAGASAAEGRLPLRVLYVGNDKVRARAHAEFLKGHFAQVTVARRDGFTPAAARGADVVLLDWSQSEGDVKNARSPLGELEGWSKPTVLLGSAGLFMAGAWQVIGGAG